MEEKKDLELCSSGELIARLLKEFFEDKQTLPEELQRIIVELRERLARLRELEFDLCEHDWCCGTWQHTSMIPVSFDPDCGRRISLQERCNKCHKTRTWELSDYHVK